MVSLGPVAKRVGTYEGCEVFMMGECKVLVSGPLEIANSGWHFSISHPDRHPTWEEQKAARYQLCPPEITMCSFMPPHSEFVNIHDHCFHWWEVRG